MKMRIFTRAQKKKKLKLKKILTKVNSALKNKPKNSRDPITLEPLSKVDKIFRLVSKSGHLYVFDAPSLLDYMKTSGKLLNPITRDKIDQIEETRLKRICGFQGHICETHERPEVISQEDEEVSEIILTDLGEIVTNFIDSCEYSCQWPLDLSQISQIRLLFTTFVRNDPSGNPIIEDDIRQAKKQFLECLDPMRLLIRQSNIYFDIDLLTKVHDLCVLTIESFSVRNFPRRR